VVTGRVRNIARPEGNITGFSTLEPSLAGKCLELLKEAAPHLTKVAIIRNPDLLSAALAATYISSIEQAARALGIQVHETLVRNAVDIVRALDTLSATPNGGLVVLPPPLTTTIRDTVLQLAAHHRLPAVYTNQPDAAAGGLMAYATDRVDLSRRAASYVDRILRGAKVADLPVQFPSKFDLVINLKTARDIGLQIPVFLQQRANEIIE
jgi:putative ABC transport system substrate-binding protein